MHFCQKHSLLSTSKTNETPWLQLQLMRRLTWAVLLIGSVIASIGCSGYSPAEHRVDTNVAHDTLQRVLSQWQQGRSSEDCLAMQPPVIVQDMDWKSGTQLDAFEIVAPGEARDANYYCEVTLSLHSSDSPPRSKKVVYLVGTSPVLTVFRSAAP
ncbi:hypothetical protein Mal33_08740 [Rosistilla oblonga]|uniref:Uncharacterized protein n=1 Tax=Rosistilla oblonga TaxID=2527990 RepID=A0A518IPA0_9BACT|nr:hypothetical protein Mal33_08740 [Rosistilla oblonga]